MCEKNNTAISPGLKCAVFYTNALKFPCKPTQMVALSTA